MAIFGLPFLLSAAGDPSLIELLELPRAVHQYAKMEPLTAINAVSHHILSALSSSLDLNFFAMNRAS
jgi:hypothetical protein